MSARSRKLWLVVSGAVMVAFFVAMGIVERRLPDGTPGIIAFEFVRTSSRAQRFLAEWGSEGRDAVKLSLYLDYGFMLGYGTFVTLAGLATRDFGRERGMRKLAAAGRVIPWFAAAAALFDAGENAFLLLTVGGHWRGAAPLLATTCSSIKWTLIAIAVVYVAWGLVARLLVNLRGRERSGA
jgi:hypothetical protein